VGAKCDGGGAQRLCEEYAVHVVLQSGRGHLRHIVARTLLAEKALKGLPGHPQRDSVHHLDAPVRKQGRHLRQAHLRPDHPFARTAAHAVLTADPDPTVWGRRVCEHNVHSARRSRRLEPGNLFVR